MEKTLALRPGSNLSNVANANPVFLTATEWIRPAHVAAGLRSADAAHSCWLAAATQAAVAVLGNR